MNASTSPIAVAPAVLLGTFATLLADMVAEAEQACESTGMFKLTAKLTALIIQHRGIEDAARFAAKISGLDIVDDPQTRAGVVVDRYLTAGGAHVTVTTTATDTATAAPGWVATCGACKWTDDQYACWHELWPAYPNIAGGDVRALLLDIAQEHADTCEVTR